MTDFYTDHNVSLDLGGLLRDRGHSVNTVRDLHLEAASDHIHLLTAARLSRVLVTHNAKDFVLLHQAWRTWSLEWKVKAGHAGILIIPQRPHWLPQRVVE